MLAAVQRPSHLCRTPPSSQVCTLPPPPPPQVYAPLRKHITRPDMKVAILGVGGLGHVRCRGRGQMEAPGGCLRTLQSCVRIIALGREPHACEGVSGSRISRLNMCPCSPCAHHLSNLSPSGLAPPCVRSSPSSTR
jgi:hypothetical protein